MKDYVLKKDLLWLKQGNVISATEDGGFQSIYDEDMIEIKNVDDYPDFFGEVEVKVKWQMTGFNEMEVEFDSEEEAEEYIQKLYAYSTALGTTFETNPYIEKN